jgi:putative ABC transport system substrate-binding protein
MRRRDVIVFLGGAAATWPLAARAQQGERLRRIGVLMEIESGPDARIRIAAFRRGLLESGWIDDRNIRIDFIWGPGDPGHVRSDAAELVRKSPEVILANGPVPTLELQRMTGSIPIVFVQVPDPVGLGVVANIARPGANITGFTHFEMAFAGNWRHSKRSPRAQDASCSWRLLGTPHGPGSYGRSPSQHLHLA